jgi:hypothetical protein
MLPIRLNLELTGIFRDRLKIPELVEKSYLSPKNPLS